MQLGLNNQKTIFEFRLPDIIAQSQRTLQLLVQLVPVVGFFKIHLVCHFLSKLTHGKLPNCLLSNPLQSHRFQVRNSAYRSGLCISSKYISCSRRGKHIVPLFPRFVPKDQIKPFAHDENELWELWEKIYLFNVF